MISDIQVVVAPDSFKESASAAEVAAALAEGVRRALPHARVTQIPMADGGEGAVDALLAAVGGERIELKATGPLGEPVDAFYGLIDGGKTAIIEMAAASGLALVPPERRDPRITTTCGTGELIHDALDRGVDRIIIGLGGSATNDGGAGMAQALGCHLYDGRMHELPPGGAALADLARIDINGRHPRLDTCEILVACDVTNPLVGRYGASRVYGPQKGATPEIVEELDAALSHYGAMIESQLGIPVIDIPGAGAAGGLAAGLMAFADGKIRRGFEIIAEACRLRERLRGVDLVLTGEGCLDEQTANGKVPAGVAELAAEAGASAIAFAGRLKPGYETLYAMGLDAAFAIADGPMPFEESRSRIAVLLAHAAENAVRAWRAGRRSGA